MQKVNKLIFLILSIVFLLMINLQVTKKVSGQPYKNYTIYIDPGHGGIDGGANVGDVKEKDLNLKVALYLRSYLEELGINVLMTRISDIDYYGNVQGSKKRSDLLTRIEMINNSQADLYVSIHMNKMANPRWSGAQVFYYPGNDNNSILANHVQQNLKELLDSKREAKSIKSLFLFKNVNKPGILIEAGFLSNPTERSLLQKSYYQEKIAHAIYLGILQYLDSL